MTFDSCSKSIHSVLCTIRPLNTRYSRNESFFSRLEGLTLSTHMSITRSSPPQEHLSEESMDSDNMGSPTGNFSVVSGEQASELSFVQEDVLADVWDDEMDV
jgi:hypothetical protein